MGYTDFTVRMLEQLIRTYNPFSVLDFGAQNMYDQPLLPAPYARQWYEQKRMHYSSIDLSGEAEALRIDLGYLIEDFPHQYDLVADAGTQEHVGRQGAFSWEAIYNCWLNKFNLCKLDGIIYNENPETGSWLLHGFQWFSKEFYQQLEKESDLKIILLDRHAAMGNTKDGWNTVCIQQKTGSKFPSFETFMTFDLRRS